MAWVTARICPRPVQTPTFNAECARYATVLVCAQPQRQAPIQKVNVILMHRAPATKMAPATEVRDVGCGSMEPNVLLQNAQQESDTPSAFVMVLVPVVIPPKPPAIHTCVGPMRA